MLYRYFTILLLVCCASLLRTINPGHAQTRPETQKLEAYLPKTMKLFIGGFLGPSYKVELKDQTLLYQEYAPGRQLKTEQVITPTGNQWRQFWESLEAVKIWNWKADYLNSSAHDGTQWNLMIEHEDKQILASGSNNYPRDGSVKRASNSPEPSKVFSQYLIAVEALLGGKQFR